MVDDALLASLLTAIDGAPDDVPLRLHLAELLSQHGRHAEAMQHCAHALQREPANATALALLRSLGDALAGAAPQHTESQQTESQQTELPEPADSSPPDGADEPARRGSDFDWSQAEEQVGDIIEPAFVQDFQPSAVDEDIERPAVRLSDVGGMENVKERLELAFLGPLRNPELTKAFGKTLTGGLLLYGPPGCGKTFIARALAGEIGAMFYSVGLADVLDMWVGNSERNLKEIFDSARRNAPCVLFFDEVDALGQKRSHLTHSSVMRNTVNQLLTQMDSVDNANEGVFVLGATNHPWDIDSALRRPGRFDRMLLVLPPDAPARAAILRHHLRDRPLAGINLDTLVRVTEDFSGADLAHLCETATERALSDSIRSGEVRPLTMDDLTAALAEVKPSTGPWFNTARNVVAFGNSDGSYDELAAYLKRRKKL